MIKRNILLVLSILFAIYGVCVGLVGSGTGFFLVWFLLAAILLALGIGLLDVLPRIVKGIVVIVFAAAIAVIVITWGCVLSDFGDRGRENLDYIVVLGAQVKKSGPSPVLRYRLDTALQYLNENPKTVCIVSGGKGYNEPAAEGSFMKEYLTEHGIDESRIIAETKSLNTAQNIENSARLFHPDTDSVGIVTNNFHVFRGLHIAKKKGYKHACGIAAPSNPFFLPNNMLRESAGIIKDLIQGNI